MTRMTSTDAKHPCRLQPTSCVDARGRITVPVEIRRATGLGAGVKLHWAVLPTHAILLTVASGKP
jgi:hypothetical protein